MEVSAVCNLITEIYTKDNQGYESITENPKQVFCLWTDGVSQNEFYMSHKEGFEASASVDIFVGDYNRQRIIDFNGRRYNVIRVFQRRPDYVTLILEEVVR